MNNLGALLNKHQANIYFDVTPLLDRFWTGIPVVAAQLARAFLNDAPDRTRFFFEDFQISGEAVIEALIRNTGFYLHRDLFHGNARVGALNVFNGVDRSIGFFPSVKRVRGSFDLEFSVIHDLSTLITPQFHHFENISYHMNTLERDVASNTLTFCVSEATLLDLELYLGISKERLALMYNACAWPADYALRFDNEIDPARVERYAVILATREPRKNMQRIFEMLVMFPHILEQYRFIFIGKTGWLEENVGLPEALKAQVAEGRIKFTGFVGEYQKYKLLRAADISIYPSFFEGFGLPVLESLSVGTPCLASWSSSLPEVGRDGCLYFDPLSTMDMYNALMRFTEFDPRQRSEIAARARATAAPFDWKRSFQSVVQGMRPFISTL